MTVIDEVILKVDVDEFTQFFGDEVNQKILSWSKNFVNMDINTFKNPEWEEKYSKSILKEVKRFCLKANEFFIRNPPKNLVQLQTLLGAYPNITNINEIEFLVICGIRTIQMTKIPKKQVNFNWVKYIALRDFFPNFPPTNYFIFIYHENKYEDHTKLGQIFDFPSNDMGEIKVLGKKWGTPVKIIDRVKIKDKVIIYISGKSKTTNRKRFWGYGVVVNIDKEKRYWEIEHKEFNKKIKLDDFVIHIPPEYQDLYKKPSDGAIYIGIKGTIQIDKIQFEYIKKISA